MTNIFDGKEYDIVLRVRMNTVVTIKKPLMGNDKGSCEPGDYGIVVDDICFNSLKDSLIDADMVEIEVVGIFRDGVELKDYGDD